MSQLVKPHGSETLNILLLEGAERESALAAAEALPKITLSSRERGDLIMLGIGGFTPLDGFMGQADWEGVCDNMALANGVFARCGAQCDRRGRPNATRGASGRSQMPPS